MFDPSPKLRALEHRLVGRVVEFDDRMHLVISVDAESGFATLAYDVHGQKRRLMMTVPEVLWWLQRASALRQESELASLTGVVQPIERAKRRA